MSHPDPSVPKAAPPRQPARRDARDLMALLYREIGISAVAAALQIDIEAGRRIAATPVKIHPVPGVLSGNDIAA